MITLTGNINTALDTNKALTWLVKLTLDDATRYWSSENCVISSQEYVGRFILDDGVDSIDNSVDISIGGGMASVGNTSLSLKEIIVQNGQHRDYKPQSAGTELLNRTVEIGCVYNFGTISDSDVVWFHKGTIDDYDYSINGINLDVIGVREIEVIDLPRTIINTTDHPYAPNENYGRPIPIGYGNFFDYADNQYVVQSWVPSICTDKVSKTYYFCDHLIFSGFGTLEVGYRTSDMKTFAKVEIETSAATFADPSYTDYNGYFNLQNGTVIGRLFHNLSLKGFSHTETNSIANILDDLDSTYTTIQNTKILALMAEGLPSGMIPTSDGKLYIGWRSDGAASSFRLGYYAPNTALYTNVVTYTGTIIQAVDVDSGLAMAGKTGGDISQYQFAINCANGADTVNISYLRVSYRFVIEQGTVSTVERFIRIPRPSSTGGRIRS